MEDITYRKGQHIRPTNRPKSPQHSTKSTTNIEDARGRGSKAGGALKMAEPAKLAGKPFATIVGEEDIQRGDAVT